MAGVSQTILTATNSQITVRIKANPATTGDVVLRATSGASIARILGWTYVAPQRVSGIAPSFGQFGTTITVAGDSLLGGADRIVNASAGGTQALSIVSSNNSYVVFQVGDSSVAPQSVNVTLIANTGTIATSTQFFEYRTIGAISNVSLADGQGGTRVTISGQRLRGHGAQVVSVTLAGVAASIASESDTAVVVRAGIRTPGTGDVVLVANTGAIVSLASGWTYNTPGEVTSISPSQGQVDTLVTISGTRLLGGGTSVSSVVLAGVSAAVVSESDTSIVVRSPGAAPGSGPVVILSDTQATVQSQAIYTHLANGTITTVQPNIGHFGTVVTVSGSRLYDGGASIVSASLATIEAAVLSHSDSRVVLRAIASLTRTGDVVLVSNTGASVTSTNGWVYGAPGNVASVNPASGQLGTVVTILGTNLAGHGTRVVNVTLGGTPVQSINFVSAAEVRVVVARAPASAAGDVILTADSGAVVSSLGAWEYLQEGAIATLAPNRG